MKKIRKPWKTLTRWQAVRGLGMLGASARDAVPMLIRLADDALNQGKVVAWMNSIRAIDPPLEEVRAALETIAGSDSGGHARVLVQGALQNGLGGPPECF